MRGAKIFCAPHRLTEVEPMPPDTGSDHVGFCLFDVGML